MSILLVLLLGRKRLVPADEVTAAQSGAGGPHLCPGQGHPQDLPQAACLRQVCFAPLSCAHQCFISDLFFY
jgi:hypothetical protein